MRNLYAYVIANYAHSTIPKKSTVAHFPLTPEVKTALDIIRFVYAVAGIPGDSPRFVYYVSRWDVPRKVTRAIASGTFDDLTANCPPIDPAWARFVPEALAEHRRFTESTTPTRPLSNTSAPNTDQTFLSANRKR